MSQMITLYNCRDVSLLDRSNLSTVPYKIDSCLSIPEFYGGECTEFCNDSRVSRGPVEALAIMLSPLDKPAGFSTSGRIVSLIFGENIDRFYRAAGVSGPDGLKNRNILGVTDRSDSAIWIGVSLEN